MDNRFIDIQGDNITAGCGVDSSMIATSAFSAGLTGMEFLYGLPGTIGGAVYMNARAYDRSISDILVSVRAMDMNGAVHVLKNKEIDFSYKDTLFQHKPMILLSAEFRINSGDRNKIQTLMDSAIEARRQKGHFDFPSCGSVFKNPYDLGIPAGKIVEKLGLKGVSKGGASIFEKHGNFIINKDNACAEDILHLISIIRKTVQKDMNYDLETEVEIW